MAAKNILLGLSTPVKVILGLGTLAGGGLAVWRAIEELVETDKLGPPAWWVIWRKPIDKFAEPPTSKTELHASRAFQWKKDRWIPLTPHWYAPSPAVGSVLAGGPPEGRLLYAQVCWERRLQNQPWKMYDVEYAKNVQSNLPR